MGHGKTLGLILFFVGLVLGLLMTVWLGTNLAEGTLQKSGFVLGLALLVVLVLPFLTAGAFVFVRGLAEDRDMARVLREEKLLGIVQARGHVPVADAAIELNASRDQVKAWIYDLVGRGLFTGYINWDDGILYSRDAASMQSTRCPRCGGEREVAGKGVVRCGYCGSELFV